ncbi:MAG: pseudouridine synthase [Candidatus Sulfotelmatobacter sp.]
MRENRPTRYVGLARTLSKLGYCSRARAADLIRAGRVSLNGKIHRDPEASVFGKYPQIAVDGIVIESRNKIYLMLNKPRGIVTTGSDEQGRETVYTVLNACSVGAAFMPRESLPWIAPVGRLDKASEGLLLLTNDSEWAARITAPETHLDKTYHVQIGAIADEETVRALVMGVKATNGEVLRAKQARRLRAGQKNCWLEIMLDEGRNRQIRRMIEALGFEVLRLVRVAIGPLRLGDLAKGEYRALIVREKKMLDRAMQNRTS